MLAHNRNAKKARAFLESIYPKQEGEFEVPVADMPALPIGLIHQCHDHEGVVDAACLLKEEKRGG